jgi:ATP-dependent Clp protease ATP-binding subunit ClpA
MSENESPEGLLLRVTKAEPSYAQHHGVTYASEAVRMSAALARRHPYMQEDPYETALDLLDEAGATVRMRRLVTEDGTHDVVGPGEVVTVASRKTGLGRDDLLQ